MKACIKRTWAPLAVALVLSANVWAEPRLTVNFKDSDIQEVILYVADATGKTIIIDPKVRGQVKVVSVNPLTPTELYELFLSILDVHGFTAVESGNVVRIVPNRDARSLPVPSEDRVSRPDDTYITQVIQLQNISAAKVLPTLRPLVPQHGHLSAYDPSNAIIITDTRANIVRINEIIERIDRSSVVATDLIELRYAKAADVVTVITQLEKPDPNRSGAVPQMSVVADQRINGVLVNGDELQRQRVRELIARLDRPQAINSNVRVIYLRYAKAEQVANVLSGVLQNLARLRGSDGAAAASVQADTDTNAILITADPSTMDSLLSVVDSLDIRRAQVLVEAIIVEIEDTGERELGIQWMYRDNDYGFGGSTLGDGSLGAIGQGALQTLSGTQSQRDAGLLSLAGSIATTPGQTFGIGRLGERTDFLAILNMLQRSSATNILSTPNLLTTDNHTASISVGQNVPFVTGSYSGVGGTTSPQNPFQTIERRDVGILLEVTPHVNEGDSVVLDISQEVSSLSGLGGTAGPITNQRKINTQILAADGETVVLGGLIQDDVQTYEQRVPILGSIPILGHLFRSQGSETRKTNLLVFIRATVIRDDRMLVGATAEKYRVIRDEQEQRRRNTSWLISDRQIPVPVLPEWESLQRQPPVEADSDASAED